VPQKILIINANSFNSGIGRYSNFLQEAMAPNSEILNLKMDKNILYEKGVTIKGLFPPISSGWTINTTFYDAIFNKRIKKISVNSIIHYSTILGKPLENSLATVHDLFFLKYDDNYPSHFKRWLTKNVKYYKKLKNIITVSDYVKKQLINSGFEGTITRIYPPVSKNIFHMGEKEKLREALNLPLNKTLILTIASNEKRKNLKIIKDIAENTEYCFVNVGNSNAGNINFKSINEKQLNSLYNACDVLLSPSLDEGFGFPVVEAMSVGLPVVASDIEIYREITEGNAILVDVSDYNKVITGIKEALSNIDSLSRNGQIFARKYSFNIFKANLIKFFEETFPAENRKILSLD
jgi:glycosyltransferase involved in cell wall biosynthesis